jgi:hypothetical protein
VNNAAKKNAPQRALGMKSTCAAPRRIDAAIPAMLRAFTTDAAPTVWLIHMPRSSIPTVDANNPRRIPGNQRLGDVSPISPLLTLKTLLAECRSSGVNLRRLLGLFDRRPVED